MSRPRPFGLAGRSGGFLGPDLRCDARRCGQERGFDVVPGHARWQEDRDDVGCLVPWPELLPDLVAGSVGGELVKDELGVGGTVPRRGLGHGFAARMALTSVA